MNGTHLTAESSEKNSSSNTGGSGVHNTLSAAAESSQKHTSNGMGASVSKTGNSQGNSLDSSSSNFGGASSRGSGTLNGSMGRVFVIGGKCYNAKGEEVDPLAMQQQHNTATPQIQRSGSGSEQLDQTGKSFSVVKLTDDPKPAVPR